MALAAKKLILKFILFSPCKTAGLLSRYRYEPEQYIIGIKNTTPNNHLASNTYKRDAHFSVRVSFNSKFPFRRDAADKPIYRDRWDRYKAWAVSRPKAYSRMSRFANRAPTTKKRPLTQTLQSFHCHPIPDPNFRSGGMQAQEREAKRPKAYLSYVEAGERAP